MPDIGTELKRLDEGDWTALLAAAASGDRDSLGRLYDASGSLLYSLALRILKNSADAEEVIVDVFSQAWSRGRSFDPQRGTAAAWLITLTRSRCLDRLRKDQVRRRAEEQARQAGTEYCPEPYMAFEAERVRIAMGQLPPEQRELLNQAYFSGLSQTEIAEKLGLPLGTVKTRTRMALMRMRDLLKSARGLDT